MDKYPSIETVFVRSKETNRLVFGQQRSEETDCVKEWTVSEKIDGTNIRVIITALGVDVRGRTNAANLNQRLVTNIRSLFDHARIIRYFQDRKPNGLLVDDWVVTFYGEGYGPGIQKVGSRYSDTLSFRCFDLMYGLEHWADDYSMRGICHDLDIPTAPLLGFIDEIPETLEQLTEILPESLVARTEKNEFFEGEGIVAKPRRVLLDYQGNRVCWKLTRREYEAGTRA